MVEREEKKVKLYRVAGLNSFFTQNSCLQIDIYGKVDVTQDPPLINEYFFVFKIRKPVDKKQVRLPNNQIKEVPVFYTYDPTTNTRKTNDTFIILSQREVIQLRELLTDIYFINKDIKIDSSINEQKIISNLISIHDLKESISSQGNTIYSLNFFRPNKTVNIILMPPTQNFSTFGIQFRITPIGKEPYTFIIRDNYELLRLTETLEIATKEVLKRNIDKDFERFLIKIEYFTQKPSEKLSTDKNIISDTSVVSEDLPLEIEIEEITEEITEELTEPFELEVDLEPKTFEPATKQTPETFEPATKQTNTQSQSTSFSGKNTSFHKPYSNKYSNKITK
ncbi:MAG: hypothetical protein QW067_07590 [Thermofilaceae archaeon]